MIDCSVLIELRFLFNLCYNSRIFESPRLPAFEDYKQGSRIEEQIYFNFSVSILTFVSDKRGYTSSA